MSGWFSPWLSRFSRQELRIYRNKCIWIYSHRTDYFLLGDLHFCSPVLQPMEGEERTTKRRWHFIILRPFISCIFAPAWSGVEDRNNGHTNEVLRGTARRISWIQEVSQVPINISNYLQYYIQVVGLQNSALFLFHPHHCVLNTWTRLTCTQQQPTWRCLELRFPSLTIYKFLFALAE